MPLILNLNGYTINCEVARTSSELTLGLQGHESLNEDEGLLFIFERIKDATFHMGKVRFPIDIIGIDENSRVTSIVENAEPGSRDNWTFPRVMAVLETNGGMTSGINLKPGDEITAIDSLNKNADALDEDSLGIQQMREREEGKDISEQHTDRELPEKSVERSPFMSEPNDKYYGDLWSDLESGETKDVPPELITRASLSRKGSRFSRICSRFSRKSQIVDEEKFVQKVSNILLSHGDEIEWKSDALNGGATQSAVINRASLARLLESGGAEKGSIQYILDAASDSRGLQLIGNAYVLAGLADYARLSPQNSTSSPILVVYKSTESV